MIPQGMSWEEISIRNLVWWYREGLSCDPILLTKTEKRRFKKMGLLVRTLGSKRTFLKLSSYGARLLKEEMEK